MEKRRIAVITPEFVTEKYFSGGIAQHFYRLFKHIASLGHEVELITFSKDNNDSFHFEGLQVHRLNVPLYTGSFQLWMNRFSRYHFPETIRWLDFSIKAYQKINSLHRQNPFDIIHFSNYFSCGLITSLFMPVHHVVRISSFAPLWDKKQGLKAKKKPDLRLLEWLESLQFRISHNIYAPSYALKTVIEQTLKINNIKVIRTPIYLETLAWDASIYEQQLKNKKYLLYFGRYQLHKGFHILAQALPQLFETYPELNAVFVGLDLPTELAPSMKDYAMALNEKYIDRLIFLDALPHDKLYPLIQQAHLVVLPSLADNLPNTLIESMALGKAVIGTIGTSFDELITDGETGYLVPADNVEALADKISSVWNDGDLDRIGKAAKLKMKELSPEVTVHRAFAIL